MLRKNGFLGLVVLFVVLLVSFGAAAAQQAQPAPQTTPDVQPAQPTMAVQPIQPTAAQPAQPTTAVQPATSTTQAEQYPFLGVRLADTTNGIVVRQVLSDAPAATAGIQLNDTVQKVNDTAVASVAEFATALNALKPGDTVTIALTRAGKAMSVQAKLGSTGTEDTLVTTEAFNAITFNSADSTWQVFSLASGSDLASAGLQAGDTLKQFNGQAYKPTDLQAFRDKLTDKDQVKLTIERAGKSMDINVPAPAFKSLDLFNYAQQGMLFDLAAQTQNPAPSVNLANLAHNIPFDALGYNSSDKFWHVFGIASGSALAAAGLQANDQIMQFNGAGYDPAALQAFRDKLADSDMVKITIMRAGKQMDISVPAATINGLHLLDNKTDGMLFEMPDNQLGPFIGVTGVDLTAAIAQQQKITQTQGALVMSVDPKSPAAAAGLQQNDVITAVAAQKIDAQHTLDSLLETHKIGETVKLTIMRGDKSMDMSVTLGKPDISGEIPFLIRPL
jgi:S1-C subfamily serine protease